MRSTNYLSHKTLNWVLTVLLVILVMATPALAAALANSVGSVAIIDGSIKTVDIAKGAIKTKKIANSAVKSGKIAAGAVNSAKIADGSIVNADIAADAAIGAAKINRTGLDADLLDGKHGADYVAKTGDQTMAGNLTAANFAYGGAKTGYLSIPGNSFHPVFSTDAYDTNFWDLSATGGTGAFFAPVNLPDGATVTEFRYTVFDNVSGDSEGRLFRRNDGSSNDTISYTGASVDSGSYQTLSGAVSPGFAVIDNANYSYFILLYLDASAPSIVANRFRITYTSTSPGL
ncbi:MAG: hypothetical protein Q8L35_08745 [Actinomycetota bacterium]|nr:hypothetical protein [Actinomycetota bacterium]